MRTTPRRLGAATGEVLLKLGKSLPRMAPSRSYMTTRTSCPRTRGRAGADAQAYGVWRLQLHRLLHQCETQAAPKLALPTPSMSCVA